MGTPEADAKLLSELSKYTSCDVSDALQKLGHQNAGFLADITPRTPLPAHPIIAPATTIQFAAKSSTAFTPSPTHALLPQDTHFADAIPPQHAVVITQNEYTTNALVGGLVAARMARLGAPMIVVDGRVRDIPELNVPVYARGTSTVGTGGRSGVVGMGGEVTVEGVVVRAGDWVFADAQGVVVIPRGWLGDVLHLVKKGAEADGKVMRDVLGGRELWESFREHRG